MWYEWASLEEFNLWHNNLCVTLEIPDEVTTAYTQPIEVEGKIIAVVHQPYQTGLQETDLRPPVINRFLEL
jgi:hypothetical protein